MNVLSLCDGMSCAHIALDKAGIKVDRYFASEIKEIGIKVTKHNYPGTVHIGDVNKVSYKDGVLYWEGGEERVNIDLVCFGSPCQTFSIAIPSEQRTGLENKVKSGLFFECKRVLDEVKPKFFLMENVYSMRKSDVKTVTDIMGVEPIMINGADYKPVLRKRWYWTNISLKLEGGNRKENLNDILEDGYCNLDTARCFAVIDSRPNSTPVKMFHRYYSTGFTTLIFKSKDHYEACVEDYTRQIGGKRKCTDTSKLIPSEVYNGVRYMTTKEKMYCHGVPEHYMDILTTNEASDLLGDGWQCDVIADIFKGMKK